MSETSPTISTSERGGHNRLLLVLLTATAVAVGFLAGFLSRIPFEDSAPAAPGAGWTSARCCSAAGSNTDACSA